MGAGNWKAVKMEMVNGVEIPVPVTGAPIDQTYTKAMRAAGGAMLYRAKRVREEQVELSDGKVKFEKRYGKCPMDCEYITQEWCPHDGAVVREERAYLGMTKAEVVIHEQWDEAADGNERARTDLFDRFEGKPKQAVEATVTNFTLTDVLDQLAAMEQDDPTCAPRITVDPFSKNMNEVHLNPFDEEIEDATIVVPASRKLLEQI